jgi:hypothetical protein
LGAWILQKQCAAEALAGALAQAKVQENFLPGAKACTAQGRPQANPANRLP